MSIHQARYGDAWLPFRRQHENQTYQVYRRFHFLVKMDLKNCVPPFHLFTVEGMIYWIKIIWKYLSNVQKEMIDFSWNFFGSESRDDVILLWIRLGFYLKKKSENLENLKKKKKLLWSNFEYILIDIFTSWRYNFDIAERINFNSYFHVLFFVRI